jgi:hypothetical protein
VGLSLSARFAWDARRRIGQLYISVVAIAFTDKTVQEKSAQYAANGHGRLTALYNKGLNLPPVFEMAVLWLLI